MGNKHSSKKEKRQSSNTRKEKVSKSTKKETNKVSSNEKTNWLTQSIDSHELEQHDNLSGDYLKLLTNCNPLQTLHNEIVKCVTTISFVPNTMEIDYFVCIIVSFIGYIESTINNRTHCDYVACSSPNNILTNETCILISIPQKSKHYSNYTISNIKFHSAWINDAKLIVNIALFNNSMYIDDMKTVYKSKEIQVSSSKNKRGMNGKEMIVEINDINKTLQCGEIYIFWIEVISGSFNFGFSEYGVDGLKEKYPFLTNMYMGHWKNKKAFDYDIKHNIRKAKLFEVTFY